MLRVLPDVMFHQRLDFGALELPERLDVVAEVLEEQEALTLKTSMLGGAKTLIPDVNACSGHCRGTSHCEDASIGVGWAAPGEQLDHGCQR
eukprot:4187009-Alexandrium_andersonii.AAC.1